MKRAFAQCLTVACVACGEVRASLPDAATELDAPATETDAQLACDLRAPFGAPTPVIGASSSSFVEVTPRLSVNERVLYFHGHATNAGDSDLYVAERADRWSPFGTPRRLSLSTATNHEFNASLSADGLRLTYDSWPVGGGIGRIFVATRASIQGEFGNPVQIEGLASDPNFHDAGAIYTADDQTFWFASNRGHWSDWDLYVGRASSSGVVDLAEVAFNTSDHEASPAPSADGRSIYFSSTRPGGTGSNDIWVAHRNAGGGFDAPSPVAELNTVGSETSGWISPDGCRLYFNSDRNGTEDIFVAERQP